MFERLTRTLLLIIVAVLPFEFYVLPGDLSILQLLFIAALAIGLPVLIRNRRALISDRLVIAAICFTAMFWVTALLAPDNTSNAVKAAVRVTSGLVLMCMWISVGRTVPLGKVWCWTALAAACYGFLDHLGFGMPTLFRTMEFYVGYVRRLSGSFEYPNTAAAYYGMSLPMVWSVSPVLSLILWIDLILTYSRGALLGLFAVLIVVAVAGRSRDAWKLIAAGVGIFGAVTLFQPFLGQGLRPPRVTGSIAAAYQLRFNQIRYTPDSVGTLPVVIRNTGASEWRNADLSYHWYDTEQRRVVYVTEFHTMMPSVVRPGESVSVEASFRTPSAPGFYLLSWDLWQGSRWFSTSAGVLPGIVEATIETGAAAWRGTGDISRWYKGRREPGLDASVSRAALWGAAWQFFKQHPLRGIGPDNFRLHYGEVLGYRRWDTNVRANSLYLELLAGSGIFGIVTFGAMLAAVRWNVQPALFAVLLFLLHGAVDVFLMTTPIYFAFWILLGQVHAGGASKS